MKVNSAKFIKGIIGTDDILYNGKNQIVFIGRSNVGKSTLINSLTLKQNLVRSSSKPGKTVRMDFFLINNSFYFVDFPGYGYAKVSGKQMDKIRKMILWYLMYSEVKTNFVVLIIDAKVGMTKFDFEAVEILKQNNTPFVIAANKIDKLKMGEKERRIKEINNQILSEEIIPYSSVENTGRADLMRKIEAFIDGQKIKT